MYLGLLTYVNGFVVHVHDAVRAVGKCGLDYQALCTVDVDTGRACEAVLRLWCSVLDVPAQTPLSVVWAHILFGVHRLP